MAIRMQTFCCGCNLRTGIMLIGLFGIFSNGVGIYWNHTAAETGELDAIANLPRIQKSFSRFEYGCPCIFRRFNVGGCLSFDFLLHAEQISDTFLDYLANLCDFRLLHFEHFSHVCLGGVLVFVLLEHLRMAVNGVLHSCGVLIHRYSWSGTNIVTNEWKLAPSIRWTCLIHQNQSYACACCCDF